MRKAKGNHLIIHFPRKIFSMTGKTKITVLSLRQLFSGQGVLRISGPVMKRIGTWNVRSLFQSGKTHNAIREMERLKIDILGVSEMRWPNVGKCQVNGYYVYYSGNDDPQHLNGVGVIVHPDANKAVTKFAPVSDRVIFLQFNAQPIPLNIIQVYAPTCNASDDDIEQFYAQIKTALNLTKPHEINMIIGDFNAKVGKGRQADIVGNYGLGVCNDRGERLIQLCQEEGLTIMNTYFQLPPRRLYTWTSNADKNTRNQIDYVIINKRFKNSVNSVKTYPGADINSDHNLLVAALCLRLKKCQFRRRTERISIQKLQDPVMRTEVQAELQHKINNLIDSADARDVETTWSQIKTAVNTVSKTKLKETERNSNKTWMTEEILQLMDRRRTFKNKDPVKFGELQREIRSKIRNAKECQLSKECREIEELQAKHDFFNMYKKVKQTTGMQRNNGSGVLTDKNGNFLTSTEEKLKEWKDYVNRLFNDNRSAQHGANNNDGVDITRTEVERALLGSKNGKAPGPDEVHVEILKLLSEERSLTLLVDFFNSIYRSGTIPRDWLKSTFVTLPKKRNAKVCNEYRTISLMSHALKLFLKILHSRIYRKCEEYIGDSQLGFRNGFGTREAMFGIQVLIQRCRDVNVDVFACFVDYEKAFDTVQHDKLIRILSQLGLDGRDLRIIGNLYWNQSASVRVDGQLTEEVSILRGVRQGCVLSPLLFNIYSEKIFSDALEGMCQGVVVNGVVINNLRYADDTVLLATSLEDLQELLNAVAKTSSAMGLKLNVKKTKWMVISKNRTMNPGFLQVGNNTVERVTSYKYLGCHVNAQWDMSLEIRCRVEQARCSFQRIQKVLTSRDLTMDLRIRLLRCYVFSILLYGVEAWTLTEAMCKKLEAFEMWTYRRILKIPWIAKVTNTEVLRRMGKDTEILNAIKRRKLEYFGHVMRNDKYHLLHLVIQGKIDGNRGPGRRKISWLKNLRQWFGLSTTSLFRKAVDKVQIMLLIANVLRGQGT